MITNMPKSRSSLALTLLKDCLLSMKLKYAVFLSVILTSALIGLLPPQLYRYFMQSTNSPSVDALVHLCLFGSFIALCSLVSAVTLIIAKEWLRCEIETYLRNKVLVALCETSLSKLEEVNRGEWLHSVSGDLIETENFLTIALPEQIRNCLIFIFSSTLFIYYGDLFGGYLLLLAMVLVALNVLVQKKLKPALDEIRDLQGQVYQHLLVNFEGVRTIRSFHGEKMVQKKFGENLKRINRKCINTMRSFSFLIGTNEFMILSGITAVLGLIIFRLEIGTLTIDQALVFPFYMGLFFMSVASFYRSNFDWTMFLTKASRLATLIYCSSQDVPIRNEESASFSKETPPRLWYGDIELCHEGYPLLVPPFDMTINYGELLGVIGRSGSGKSTLLEFLAGLRRLRSKGEWCIPSALFSSYVEQKPYLFEGSLNDNLRFGCNADVSDEEIWATLEKAQLATLVKEKNGLQFFIKERGQNLSEGEKYRLGIVRALLAKKPFLLMDEPFAALDPCSIQAIVSLVNAEKMRRGIVIVTHYLPRGLLFDRIIDFDAMRAEEGIFKPNLVLNQGDNFLVV